MVIRDLEESDLEAERERFESVMARDNGEALVALMPDFIVNAMRRQLVGIVREQVRDIARQKQELATLVESLPPEGIDLW